MTRHSRWHVVYLQTLHARFEQAVTAYQADVARSPQLQRRFMKMWRYYGYVGQSWQMPSA